MRKAVRAIIIHENKLLVMHRNKFGTEYYSLIGGAIGWGETPTQSLFREIKEESGVVVTNARLVIVQEAGDPYGTQYIYLCEYVSGEPVLDPTSPEAAINKLGQNIYTPTWLELSKLHEVNFVAKVLKEPILEGATHGFPDEPIEISGS